ncbi:MAG: hypothetical protein DSY87_08095 [Methylococcus sp.]|nr:MAG: hypothetical protein DSY87_08095 [Methylococcus sp.]
MPIQIVIALVLTPKQEKFRQAYIKSGNPTEAHRRSYSTSSTIQSTIARKGFDGLTKCTKTYSLFR